MRKLFFKPTKLYKEEGFEEYGKRSKYIIIVIGDKVYNFNDYGECRISPRFEQTYKNNKYFEYFEEK